MSDVITLEFVTPNKPVTSVKVTEVTVPGELGEMTFLPEHTEIVSSLNVGRLIYKTTNKEEQTLIIRSGFVQFEEDKAIVLTEKATNIKDVDRNQLQLDKKEIESKLLKSDLMPMEAQRLQSDLKETELLLELSSQKF